MERRRLRIWDVSRLSPGFFLVLVSGLFGLGAVIGFALDCRLGVVLEQSYGLFDGNAAVTAARFLSVFWNQFRWLLAALLLSLGALGLALLPPLLIARGVLFGFSYAALFRTMAGPVLFFYFLLTACLICVPLLLISGVGMYRAGKEAFRLTPSDGFTAGSPWVLPMLLLGAVLLCLIYSAAQLWLLPGLAAYF